MEISDDPLRLMISFLRTNICNSLSDTISPSFPPQSSDLSSLFLNPTCSRLPNDRDGKIIKTAKGLSGRPRSIANLYAFAPRPSYARTCDVVNACTEVFRNWYPGSVLQLPRRARDAGTATQGTMNVSIVPFERAISRDEACSSVSSRLRPRYPPSGIDSSGVPLSGNFYRSWIECVIEFFLRRFNGVMSIGSLTKCSIFTIFALGISGKRSIPSKIFISSQSSFLGGLFHFPID